MEWTIKDERLTIETELFDFVEAMRHILKNILFRKMLYYLMNLVMKTNIWTRILINKLSHEV